MIFVSETLQRICLRCLGIGTATYTYFSRMYNLVNEFCDLFMLDVEGGAI